MGIFTPSRNIVQMHKDRNAAWFGDKRKDSEMRRWRVMLADGRLTPDMMTSTEREQLQTWIVEHPKVKR